MGTSLAAWEDRQISDHVARMDLAQAEADAASAELEILKTQAVGDLLDACPGEFGRRLDALLYEIAEALAAKRAEDARTEAAISRMELAGD